MPIIRQASDSALAQGDILRGLPTFRTQVDASAGAQQPQFLLVLSRDCNALRSDTVLVSHIVRYTQSLAETLSEETTLDEARRRFGAMRDGGAHPDTFYLGKIGDGKNRFTARLDKIHTICVPTDEEKRKTWIHEHRAYSLDLEFVRHLQTRFFASITRQGFDDHKWWPTADLTALIAVGENQLARLRSECTKKRLELERADATGKNDKHRSSLAASIKNADADVRELETELAAYRDELRGR